MIENICPLILYIDPGTGAMLFSVLMGIVSVLFFAVKGAWVKLKFMISGGKAVTATDKIPLVIFAESKRYWNVFGPICDELEKREFECEYWTTSEDDLAFNQGYKFVKPEFIGEGNKAYARLNLMNAKVCLATTPGLDVYQWKRSKNCDKYIHVFHNVAEPSLYRMFGIDYYDVIFTVGDEEERYIRKLESIRNLPEKEIAVTGQPYLDELLEKKRKADLENNSEDKHKTTVLLAPSWGETSITNLYGERLIKALIDTGYNIIYRPHPQSFTADKELMESLSSKYPDSDSFKWDKNPDNFDSLYKADVLISDFSGIVYDFAFCFDKPVLYANAGFDASVYDAWWLDDNAWSIENLPNVGRELKEDEFDELKSVIDSLMSDNAYKQKRNEIKASAWKNIGMSSQSIAEYLVNAIN